MRENPLADGRPPAIGVSVAVIVAVAIATWNIGSTDLHDYFVPWFEHLRRAGPVRAFAAPFSNYTPPYLYLLALGSLFGGLFQAWDVIKTAFLGGHFLLIAALARLLRTAGCAQPWRWAFALGIAPSLLANATIIAQCDAYWAAALVMALTAALDRRHARMFAWCGLAVALKLQAAFIGPLFLAIAVSRSLPVKLWLVAPLTYVATLGPPLLAGWPAADLFTIYFRQVEWSASLSLNAPNVWMLVDTAGLLVPAELGFIAAAGASLAFVWHFARKLDTADPVVLLRAACLAAMIVPGLLPRMHERYFFMADVLTLALMAVKPDEWRPALFAVAGSSLGILGYFTDNPAFPCVGALCMIYATWLIARACLAPSAARPPLATVTA